MLRFDPLGNSWSAVATEEAHFAGGEMPVAGEDAAFVNHTQSSKEMQHFHNIFIWKALLVFALVAVPALNGQQKQKAPPQSPCATDPQYRSFDFWLGSWTVYVGDKIAGTNTITRESEGCLLLENWVGAGGISGKSFNFFDPRIDMWRQVWVGGMGQILEFSGKVQNDVMSYSAEELTKDGKRNLHKMSFTKITADSVRQFWESSTDQGKTWSTAFDGMYVRNGN